MIPRLTPRILLLAVFVLCSVQAQSDAAVPRIGILSASTPDSAAGREQLAGFRQGLREHGYVEGTNIAIEYRFARGQFDRLPDLARELIGLRVDVVQASSNCTAVRQATWQRSSRARSPRNFLLSGLRNSSL